MLTVDLTNPDISTSGKIIVPRGTLHFFRGKFLQQGICYERLRIANFGLHPIEVFFSYELDADFADIFEVRGMTRQKRGERFPNEIHGNSISMEYRGLDGVTRRTLIRCSPDPFSIVSNQIRFEKRMRPSSVASFLLVISFETPRRKVFLNFENAIKAAESKARKSRENSCSVVTMNHRFNDWVSRSFVDLQMMLTDRLPELFCGFVRRPQEGPTAYPVACSPQAWSAGAVFLFVQASLGLTIEAPKNEVSFYQPVLPDFLQQLKINDLRVGKASVDIALERHEHTVGVNVVRKKGNVQIVAVK